MTNARLEQRKGKIGYSAAPEIACNKTCASGLFAAEEILSEGCEVSKAAAEKTLLVVIKEKTSARTMVISQEENLGEKYAHRSVSAAETCIEDDGGSRRRLISLSE